MHRLRPHTSRNSFRIEELEVPNFGVDIFAISVMLVESPVVVVQSVVVLFPKTISLVFW